MNEPHGKAMMMDLEEGEMYVVRKGHLVHLERREEDDEGMRRVRVTDTAYQAAVELGRRMRKRMRGYRPDVALVISALVMRAAESADAEEVVRTFVQALFGTTSATVASD